MQKNELKRNEDAPEVERQGWNAEDISAEASNKESDEILREMLRGDETEGTPDDRDIVGSVDVKDTDYGRKQTKKIDTDIKE